MSDEQGPAIHRTVRLPKPDDERLITLCNLTGLTISEQLRELVRGARVVSVVYVPDEASHEKALAP